MAHTDGLPAGARRALCDPDVWVYAWEDRETDAQGWIAIEADAQMDPIGGGGLFVSATATENEVVDVAKSMGHKLRVSCVSGVVRGAKGGIRYDPAAPNVLDVIGRFMRDNAPVICKAWATGPDLNTDHDTLDSLAQKHLGIPNCLHALSVRYPQAQPERMLHLLGGPTPDIEFGIAEASVGYGVACALARLAPRGSLEGLRVAIQGFGAVGSTFATYAQSMGASVVAIADRDRFLVAPQGLNINALVAHRQRTAPKSTLLIDCLQQGIGEPSASETGPSSGAIVMRGAKESDEAWLVRFLETCPEIDVFAPCAQRYVMTPATMDALARATSSSSDPAAKRRRAYIACGANNITKTPDLLKTFLNKHDIWTVPEWVSNAGTACLFMEACTSAPPDDCSFGTVLDTIGERVAAFVDRAKGLTGAEDGGEARPSDLLDACMAVAHC